MQFGARQDVFQRVGIRGCENKRRCENDYVPCTLALCPCSAGSSLFLGRSPLSAQSDAPQSQAQHPSPAQKNGASTTKLVGQPAPELPTEAQESTLTIRQTVRRVIVDVMVRDANGKPVHGLTANDFSITEDKQPQRILSFDVYDFDKASISRAPNAPPLPPGVFENIPKVPERGPLYVMLLDLVNTETTDQMTARQQVLKFIRSKPAGTRFAVFVTSDKLYLEQGFTDDKDLLYAAVNSKKSEEPCAESLHAGSQLRLRRPLHCGRYADPHRRISGRHSGPQKLDLGGGNLSPVNSPEEGNSLLADQIKAEINALAQAQSQSFRWRCAGLTRIQR